MIAASLNLWPREASSFAPEYDALALFLISVTVFFTALICLLITYFGIRYRRRQPDEVPVATREHPWLEITWIVVPLAISMVMFFWGAKLFATMKSSPKQGITINVVGKQWMWKLQQPDGSREINELHVPLGVPIRLLLTSQDVIHDFAVPSFRIKQDVLPDRFTEEWFTATEAGDFELFCSEYCGAQHSTMRGRIVVMQPIDYQNWLAGRVVRETPAQNGERLFASQGCQQCHGQIAPTLAGVFGHPVKLNNGRTVLADENYLRDSILNPSSQIVAGYPAIMPTFSQRLTEDELLDLIAYIKTLGSVSPTTRPAPDQEINQPPAVYSPAELQSSARPSP